MSEPTTPAAEAQASPPESEGKKIGTVGLIGVGLVVVIILAGIVVSLVVLQRDQDTPLVSVDAGGSSAPATPNPEAGLFEPDPEFDALGRVTYVPKNPNGVILEQSPPPPGRSADTAPSGVMLQRIHGNMVLPFSTSDGPSAIDASGVATGFAHTPQGAALAAAHYMAYLASGNDRIDMAVASGRIDDPERTMEQSKRYNDSGVRGSVPDGYLALALPSLRLSYNDSLTRVWFGYSVNLQNGSTQYRRINADFVWREDRGWVLQVRPFDSAQGSTFGGSTDSRPFEPGWLTWW
ncbi:MULTISPECIES: hypothetical protein [Nocardiaceae]|uniref:hypothetical protein n=1 Tax=Nocardiaceae TaxID=85025 RepID=UPI00069009D8|nr:MULTISPECIES: hypothetical protein [Rhodococcus]OZD15816.1 hypothetical protein CH253_22920 [Rhodococcus sp. 06-156-3C]OZD32382.1 hypothetical protein CH284_21085 [Rhodococcus sp. 06-156-3]OZD36604.1 hypothetical protein CH247_03505 [Rhodococcus sp. 06-156-3b]